MGGQLPARRRGARQRAFAKRERALASIAERQHGAISRRQLIASGLSVRTIERRVEAGQLCLVHRGVYAVGPCRLEQRGLWMAAVLACGEDALLSHRSAAALWGLMRYTGGSVEVTSARGRRRPGITVHEGAIHPEDHATVGAVPVTSVARTLFDLAEVVAEDCLEGVFEEADRLRLPYLQELEAVCARGYGRRSLPVVRRLIDAARYVETTRSPLEDRVLALCRKYGLPPPATNVEVLGHEVDIYWPRQKLMIETDGYAYHGHRAAFERDRARDAAMQAAGYRVVRLTHRRLEGEPATVADEIRRLLDLDLETARAGS
jgi:Transcriptional regulator, AbiEi antitoxin/Protein of unknown function (DUF559)